jgi:fucose 4-O-acetylase-like acetyltransferase
MLWVVIGHAFIGDLDKQASWPIWERSLMGIAYSFHMPLFMLVSGWLFFKTRLIAIDPSWGGAKMDVWQNY